jgi:hypothetical protein
LRSARACAFSREVLIDCNRDRKLAGLGLCSIWSWETQLSAMLFKARRVSSVREILPAVSRAANCGGRRRHMDSYDFIVIATGTVAHVAAGRGSRVAVIDHRPFGGTL